MGAYGWSPAEECAASPLTHLDNHRRATPSANNVAAMNLLQLDLLTQDEEKNYRERAIKVVQAAGGIVLKAHQVDCPNARYLHC